MAGIGFRNRIRAMWLFFRRPHARWPLGIILFAGFLAGITTLGGYNAVVLYTNKMSFCTSCHEMRDFVYKDYIHSVHYKNPVGVRAKCANCHEPPVWGPQFISKVLSVRELYRHFSNHFESAIATRKLFDKTRPELDKRVWAEMKANDSRNCRSCHSWSAMLTSAQPAAARGAHIMGHKNGLTCIDCHKGIMRLRVNFTAKTVAQQTGE